MPLSPIRPSRRSNQMRPFQVMEILEEAMALEKNGAKVIHMEVGEPDFPTPAAIREAAQEALRKGETRYTHSLGLPELREAVAAHYREKYGVTVDMEQVVITSGTSPAMLLALSALLDPGDEIILTDPCYACYPNFVNYTGAKAVAVDISEQEGWQVPPEKLRRALSPRTRAILLNSPGNPTGAVLSADNLRQVSAAAPFVLSDEIYHGLVYGEKEHSVLEFTDRAIVFNGFSKLYAMTGWRLGYLIAPRELVRPIQKLQQSFFISPNSFVQRAGVAALTTAREDVSQMVSTFDERRRHLLSGLRRLGFSLACEPRGAFYVLADLRPLLGQQIHSLHLARDILFEVRLALTPGSDFGSNSEGFLRFSYATSRQNIDEGLERLEQYLTRIIL